MQQCLLHTLNNLLQETAFTSSDLDKLADALAPGNLPLPLLHPHRTLFVGNWDVSVLEVAIGSVGKSLKWHDQRDSEFKKSPGLTSCNGVVVNIKPPGRFAALLGSRHWFAIKKLEGVWYNLDSKLPAPKRISEFVPPKVGSSCHGGGAGGVSNKGADGSALGDEDTALRIFLTSLQKDSDAKVFLIF